MFTYLLLKLKKKSKQGLLMLCYYEERELQNEKK